MAIKVIQESLESVPEGLHEYYKETDGGFVLNVEGIDSHPDVSNLRNAYQRVKESDKEARAMLGEYKQKAENLPEDFDPKLWKQAKSGELTEGLVEVRKQLEQELEQAKSRAASYEQQIQTLTVDRTLGDALEAANITNPAYKKAVTTMLRDKVKLDGENVIVESDMGPISARDYVQKWVSTDEGKPFVSQPSGGGSKSGQPGVTKGAKDWSEAKTRAEKVELIRSKVNPS